MHTPKIHFADSFSDQILNWFDHHGRKWLPWQKHSDPYGIWVSEIMLQQTQVDTVIPYYQRFMQRFPSIGALADATEDQVMELWSGLGYYARARNLHKAAKQIVQHHNGEFPSSIDEVMALSGIGRSTAGAILAFSMHQRHPILDGNVKRVLTRIFAIEGFPGVKSVERSLWNIAEQLTPARRVADYTQAMMDLGATVCKRTKPICTQCPVNHSCKAFAQNNPEAYPQPKPKARRAYKKCQMLVIYNQNNEILLLKRPATGIWGGLWTCPDLDHEFTDLNQWCKGNLGFGVEPTDQFPVIHHKFTHFDLDIAPVVCRMKNEPKQIMDDGGQLWYNPKQAAQIGLPTPMKNILNRFYER